MTCDILPSILRKLSFSWCQEAHIVSRRPKNKTVFFRDFMDTAPLRCWNQERMFSYLIFTPAWNCFTPEQGWGSQREIWSTSGRKWLCCGKVIHADSQMIIRRFWNNSCSPFSLPLACLVQWMLLLTPKGNILSQRFFELGRGHRRYGTSATAKFWFLWTYIPMASFRIPADQSPCHIYEFES